MNVICSTCIHPSYRGALSGKPVRFGGWRAEKKQQLRTLVPALQTEKAKLIGKLGLVLASGATGAGAVEYFAENPDLKDHLRGSMLAITATIILVKAIAKRLEQEKAKLAHERTRIVSALVHKANTRLPDMSPLSGD